MLWFHNAKMCGKEICPGFVTSLWSEEFGEDYSHQALLLHRVCCEASLALSWTSTLKSRGLPCNVNYNTFALLLKPTVHL